GSLPFACSLCGSCTDVCPVKIDLHHQLLAWRKEIAHRGLLPRSKRWSMKLASAVFGNTWLYTLAGKLARAIVPRLPRFMVYNRFNAWGQKRELPAFPKQSFRELYRQRRSGTNGKVAATDFTDGTDQKGTRT
ncbi:MAG TPA: lactate utilization protein LutB domain-containing protein, partial [Pirellulales bacterium]|nr:lactate utilization protein LutB domain-containing protein [Pirellulales bacterium]